MLTKNLWFQDFLEKIMLHDYEKTPLGRWRKIDKVLMIDHLERQETFGFGRFWQSGSRNVQFWPEIGQRRSTKDTVMAQDKDQAILRVIDWGKPSPSFSSSLHESQVEFFSRMEQELFKKNLKLNVFDERFSSSVCCSMLKTSSHLFVSVSFTTLKPLWDIASW